MRIRPAALLVIPALLTACSTPAAPGGSGTTTATTARESAAAPAPAVPAAPAETTAAADPAPKTCTVPDVVGMVHQTAQDTMQAAGLFVLAEEDATGQGRVLVLDRNWITTAQSVRAGAVVDCDTKITLSAKKKGE